MVPTDSLSVEIADFAKQTIESDVKVGQTDSLPMAIADWQTIIDSNLDIVCPDSSQKEVVRTSDVQLLSTIGDFRPSPTQPYVQSRIQEFSRPSSYNDDL